VCVCVCVCAYYGGATTETTKVTTETKPYERCTQAAFPNFIINKLIIMLMKIIIVVAVVAVVVVVICLVQCHLHHLRHMHL